MKEKKLNRPDDGYRFGKLNAYFILVVCCLLYLVNYMDRQVLSVVQENMKIDLGLSDMEIGCIQTLFLLGMAFFSLPLAHLADRWSRKKMIGLLAIFWSLSTFATGLGRNFVTVLIPRFLTGAGEAGFTSGGTPLMAAAFPNRIRGTILGIFNMMVPLGAAAGVIIGGYLSAKNGGWRTPFYVFMVPGLVLGGVAFFCKDYKTVKLEGSQKKEAKFINGVVALFKIPSLRWLYLGYAMFQFTNSAFFVWGPSFMIRAQHIGEEQAGVLIGAIGIIAIVGAVGGGVLADHLQQRYSNARMMYPAVAVATAAFCFVGAIAFHFQGIGYLLAVFYGILSMSSIAPLTSVTQDVVKPQSKGTAWGMNVLNQYLLGGGWSPLLVGLLSDRFGGGTSGLKIALFISTAGTILAGAFFYMGARHYPDDCSKVKDALIEV